MGGTFYGTTEYGGGTGCYQGCGTVFSITPQGVETVLYSFQAGTDGAKPLAGLIDVGGTLYGTTANGGGSTAPSCNPEGCGTVFSITPQGVETVLYSFQGGSDGAVPEADLIDVGGTLYGTTKNGGARCGAFGCGTVFSVTLQGVETVLHSFRRSQGIEPRADLVNVHGTLYGTTTFGGADANGTVFKIRP